MEEGRPEGIEGDILLHLFSDRLEGAKCVRVQLKKQAIAVGPNEPHAHEIRRRSCFDGILIMSTIGFV
jgi:hypothetical protein